MKKNTILLIILVLILFLTCSSCGRIDTAPSSLQDSENSGLTVPEELLTPYVLPTQKNSTPCAQGEHLFVPDHCCLCGYTPNTIDDDLIVGWSVSSKYQSIDYTTSIDPFDGIVYIPDTFEQTVIKEVHATMGGRHDEIKEIILPETVTLIDISAQHGAPSDTTKVKRIVIYGSDTLKIEFLSGLEQLTEIVINPNRTITCGIGCFKNCTSLSKVTLPHIEVFSQDLFENCNQLKDIVVPDALTKIDRGAFSGCSSLDSIHFLGTTEQWKRVEISEGIGNPQTITVYCTNGTAAISST